VWQMSQNTALGRSEVGNWELEGVVRIQCGDGYIWDK
jgi:hypothetical protein